MELSVVQGKKKRALCGTKCGPRTKKRVPSVVLSVVSGTRCVSSVILSVILVKRRTSSVALSVVQ